MASVLVLLIVLVVLLAAIAALALLVFLIIKYLRVSIDEKDGLIEKPSTPNVE